MIILSMCQMVLERIFWPTHDEDSEASLEDTCRLTGFLRTFIGNGNYEKSTDFFALDAGFF